MNLLLKKVIFRDFLQNDGRLDNLLRLNRGNCVMHYSTYNLNHVYFINTSALAGQCTLLTAIVGRH